MGMNRNALLIYLENIRDLEVAKEQVRRIEINAKKDRDMLLSGLSRSIERKEPPVKEDYVKTNSGFLLGATLVTGLFLIGALCFGAVIAGAVVNQSGLGNVGRNSFEQFMGIGIVIIIGVCVYSFFSAKKIQNESEQKYLDACKEYKNYNDAVEIQEKKNKEQYEAVYKTYNDKLAYYQSENKKIVNMLDEFYSMNIIPFQFRDLKRMIYIYDSMSTSETTLEATLFQTPIEDGVKRIEDKLDIILERVNRHIVETRCINEKNRETVQRQIESNNLMLHNLKKAEQNEADANSYEKLIKNYAMANLYFGYSYLKVIEEMR